MSSSSNHPEIINDNNNSSNNNNNYNNSEMSSLQTELEELETQLGRNNSNSNSNNNNNNNNGDRGGGENRSIGHAVFRSINSALGNLRTRMERAAAAPTAATTEDGAVMEDDTDAVATRNISSSSSSSSTAITATTGVTAAATYTDRLMERLRRAEFAHSTRIPLDRLPIDFHRRPTTGTDDSDQHHINNNNNDKRYTTASSSSSSMNEQRTYSSPSIASIPTTSPRRRESILLASRRRVEEYEDENLHRIVSNTQINAIDDTDVVDMDDLDAVAAVADTQSNTDFKIDDELPTILLTKKSRTGMDRLQQSVLFPERTTSVTQLSLEPPITTTASSNSSSSTILYSWGSGGIHSFHDHGNDISLMDARVSSDTRAGRTEIVSCSVGEHHAACTTSSGQILIVGCNTYGEVDPDRSTERIIVKPSLLESLHQARIIQVSCGYNHTAALHSNGSVITWGSNEYGQLGRHSTATAATTTLNNNTHQQLSFCRPAAMVLGPERYATAVACGDGFTICLTTRMSAVVCGVKEITGVVNNDDAMKNYAPRTIPVLDDLPLVGITAGRRHVVVWTTHGSAFAWGENFFGACGREYPTMLTVPVPMKLPTDQLNESIKFLPHPLSSWVYTDQERRLVSIPDDVAVIHAACGSNHTVLVSRSGRLFVCGSNGNGQLGLDMKQYEKVHSPMVLHHPNSSRQFTSADAGENHTILLDNFGDVWQMGGTSDEVGITQCFVGKAVRAVRAGGNHSIAIAVKPGRTSMTREFSDAILKSENFQVSGCVEELIDELAANEGMELDVESRHNAVMSKITKSAEELFRTPAVLNSLFIDPFELDDLFTKILSIQSITSRQTIVSAIERGMRKGIDSLIIDGTRCVWPEQVRFLLLYIQTPMFIDSKTEGRIFDRRGDLILSLCEAIVGIPYEGYTALMGWATTVYPKTLFERLLIRPLLAQLQKAMSVEAGAERRPIPLIVAVLRWLYNASTRAGNIVSPDTFYCPAISNMHPQILYKDLEHYKATSKRKEIADFSFCGNTFLFSPTTKRNLLQIENEMNMLKVAATGLTYNVQDQTFSFNPYYVLDIDREYLLTQTLQKISQAEPSDLRKKLRVVFKGEDGVDAGGVTREFFQLLAAQLFDFNTGMWSSRFQDGTTTWFNADCFWNDEEYYLSGILVGLAVYNSTLLDVHFPSAVYRKLLAQPLGLEDMVDDDIRHGLQQLLDYEGDDVEDVFCLTFEVNWVDLGQEKMKELKPNGSNIAVTSDNKEEYVLLYVKWLLTDSIYPQFNSFEAGFMRVMENTSLDLLQPDDLELLVVGSRELDFIALQNNTEYEGGYDTKTPVIINFWRYVQSASHIVHMNLLKFVTGSTRAPIGGLGKLNFKIQRAGPDSMHLPTSHTCFNTLLLPDYGNNYDKLEERMNRAVLECEGFGLQ